MFVLKSKSGTPIANFKYKAIREDGEIFYGTTNERGETLRIQTGENKLKLKLFEDDRDKLKTLALKAQNAMSAVKDTLIKGI